MRECLSVVRSLNSEGARPTCAATKLEVSCGATISCRNMKPDVADSPCKRLVFDFAYLHTSAKDS